MTVQNITSIVQATVSVVGFFFVIYQIIQLINGIKGTTEDRLYGQYGNICKTFMDKPHLHEYFYTNKKLEESPTDSKLRTEIDIMSEMILALIEHSVMQQQNMPTDAWKNCWLPYAKERIAKSAEMRRFFDSNKNWYSSALNKLMDEIWPRLDRSS
jgi:hypothetical protein